MAVGARVAEPGGAGVVAEAIVGPLARVVAQGRRARGRRAAAVGAVGAGVAHGAEVVIGAVAIAVEVVVLVVGIPGGGRDGRMSGWWAQRPNFLP